MYFSIPNHRIIATYGVGSGNAPALSLMMSVGHLLVAYFQILNHHYYEQRSKCTRTGARRC